MKKNITKILLLTICLTLSGCPQITKAASLVTYDLVPDQFFEINGQNFGLSARPLYSNVCFNDDSNCFGSSAFFGSWVWSDKKIKLQAPLDVPISGDIIVYVPVEENSCYGEIDFCQSYTTTEEKARFSYKINPLIKKIAAPLAKPGEKIVISGGGFGQEQGTVKFGEYNADIMSWDYENIEVVVPQITNGFTDIVKVTTKIGTSSIKFIAGDMISNDEFSKEQKYLEEIDIESAWKKVGQNEVIVAVIADGVWAEHPELKDKIWKNQNEIAGNGKDDDNNGYIDDIHGWNFIDNNSDTNLFGKYGTMASGIIAAKYNNYSGIAGISDTAKIMPIVACNESCNVDSLIKSIEYAAKNKADIIYINPSDKGIIEYSQKFNAVIEQAYGQGIVTVVPAGNEDQLKEGINLNYFPKSIACNNSYKQMMLVASIVEDNKEVSWANYGNSCVNISAPGINIIGPSPEDFSNFESLFRKDSGSSFSAAIVAGVAAMLKATYPKMTGKEIIERIISTANTITASSQKYKDQIGKKINASQAIWGTSAQLISYGVTPQELKGELIKIKDNSTIYLIDGINIYPFPNQKVYASWFGNDFSLVKTLNREEIAKYKWAGNIRYKPGSLMKITASPNVYLITDNGIARWINSEEKLKELGLSLSQVEDLPEIFFFSYSIGQPIE